MSQAAEIIPLRNVKPARQPRRNRGKRSAPAGEAATELRLRSAIEVAQMCGVHASTVTDWIAKGQIRAFKLGKAVRVDMDSVVAFLERSRIRPAYQQDDQP